MPRIDVVIVGGGAAGTFLALALAGRLGDRCHITMFDRYGRFGRGVAYSATAPWHRVNVPATKMGGRSDEDTNGFIDWLDRGGHLRSHDHADAFVPRALFGEYLNDGLAEAAAGGTVDLHPRAVVAVEPHERGYRVKTETGEDIRADAVVFCLGNPPSAPIAAIPASERYVADVWRPGVLANIAAQDEVLLIGSGATAVDVVLDLVNREVCRRIHMISRKGLLPRVDVPQMAYAGFQQLDLQTATVRSLTRLLRNEIKRAAMAGIPWQPVVDAFRVHVEPIWQQSSDHERLKFLRHLRSFWLVHRHRLAPDIADLLTRLQADGILSVRAGRLLRAEPTTAGYRVNIAERTRQAYCLAVNWIIGCAGPEERYERLADPLVQQLFATGMARPGPLQLGLDIDDRAALARS